MIEMEDPREQLRAIRSLMERATIYRALSAPTALVGGLLSFAAFGISWPAAQGGREGLTPQEFVVLWVSVLILTGVCNAFFLWRNATRRGENFFSSGMKTALASVAPAFITAGVFTLVLSRPADLCILWIILYGLGLLATQHFAPRSLVMLGRTFFVAGCALAFYWRHILFASGESIPTSTVSLLMALSFGGVHLIYAAIVWLSGEEKRSTADA